MRQAPPRSAFRDDLRSRLYWLLPAALLATSVATGGFLSVLVLAPATPGPPPLVVQLVEVRPVEAPTPPPTPQAETPAAPAPEVTRPELAPTPVPKPAPAPVLKPTPRRISPAPASPADTEPAPRPSLEPPPVSARPSLGDSVAARAIFKPMPELPDDLRRRDIRWMAVARFHIAPDGSATVELIEPTAEPRVNLLLLGALRRWRFFPAIENGKPIASDLDLRIPISVQ